MTHDSSYSLLAVLLLAASLLMAAGQGSAQVLKVADLTTEDIRQLDRDRTVVLLPGGVLEEHGPHLPSFTDGYMNEWWSRQLAEAIVSRSGWVVLQFPLLPLGHGAPNDLAEKFSFPGSYGVRASVLRAVYMDLASQLGEQGFRWIFVIQNHGAPLHNQALDQAGDFFRDLYGGAMVHLFGRQIPAAFGAPPSLPDDQARENGLDIHAGASETSRMLFLRPDLVRPIYRDLAPAAAQTFAGLVEVARSPDWQGYFGSPRLATAAHGVAVMHYRGDAYVSLALQILDGLDEATIPRLFSDEQLGDQRPSVEVSLGRERDITRVQREWLEARNIRW